MISADSFADNLMQSYVNYRGSTESFVEEPNNFSNDWFYISFTKSINVS
jgi:hypothetical protein